MKEFLKPDGEITSRLIRDVIQVVTGSAKSKNWGKIIAFFLRSLEHEFYKDRGLMDDLLELFVVLFLKSDEAVKVTLLVDIQNVFQTLKQNETRIFVD